MTSINVSSTQQTMDPIGDKVCKWGTNRAIPQDNICDIRTQCAICIFKKKKAFVYD